MSVVAVGKPVPDFTLYASNGKKVSLSDFRGKNVVIYFYPKDMTPTCTAESCNFRDVHPQFSKLNTVVLGISPDRIESHQKFIQKHNLPFLLLSDPDHKVAETFDVWRQKSMFGKKYMGIERSTFLIDKNGTLVKEWRKVRVKGHVEKVLEEVKRLDQAT